MTDRPDTAAPTPPRGVRLEWIAYPLAALVALVSAFLWLRPHSYAGLLIQSPSKAVAMDGLVFTNGEPADLDSFAGDVTLIYFGYTDCPDICPTTLANVAKARASLGRDADRLHVLMVTVDPERDTAEVLGDYVSHFDQTFLGVSGHPEDLARVATLYGIYVLRGEGTVESGYDVDHTATLMAVDRDGYLRVVYSYGVEPEALASDLKELLG